MSNNRIHVDGDSQSSIISNEHTCYICRNHRTDSLPRSLSTASRGTGPGCVTPAAGGPWVFSLSRVQACPGRSQCLTTHRRGKVGARPSVFRRDGHLLVGVDDAEHRCC